MPDNRTLNEAFEDLNPLVRAVLVIGGSVAVVVGGAWFVARLFGV